MCQKLQKSTRFLIEEEEEEEVSPTAFQAAFKSLAQWNNNRRKKRKKKESLYDEECAGNEASFMSQSAADVKKVTYLLRKHRWWTNSSVCNIKFLQLHWFVMIHILCNQRRQSRDFVARFGDFNSVTFLADVSDGPALNTPQLSWKGRFTRLYISV